MKNLKKREGITLLSLSIYIVALFLIIGILVSIRAFFFKNMDVVRNSARYAVAFDNFNSNFVKDVKNNSYATIENDTNNGNIYITFEDGITYTYSSSDSGIYRDKVKIANKVKAFKASDRDIVINGREKKVITIDIVIGDTSNTLFDKKIDYTLKYW